MAVHQTAQGQPGPDSTGEELPGVGLQALEPILTRIGIGLVLIRDERISKLNQPASVLLGLAPGDPLPEGLENPDLGPATDRRPGSEDQPRMWIDPEGRVHHLRITSLPIDPGAAEARLILLRPTDQTGPTAKVLAFGRSIAARRIEPEDLEEVLGEGLELILEVLEGIFGEVYVKDETTGAFDSRVTLGPDRGGRTDRRLEPGSGPALYLENKRSYYLGSGLRRPNLKTPPGVSLGALIPVLDGRRAAAGIVCWTATEEPPDKLHRLLSEAVAAELGSYLSRAKREAEARQLSSGLDLFWSDSPIPTWVFDPSRLIEEETPTFPNLITHPARFDKFLNKIEVVARNEAASRLWAEAEGVMDQGGLPRVLGRSVMTAIWSAEPDRSPRSGGVMIDRQGAFRNLEATAYPVRAKASTPLRCVVQVRDLGDSTLEPATAVQPIQLLESLPLPVMIIDGQARVEASNRACLDHLPGLEGLAREDSLELILPPREKGPWKQALAKVLATGRAAEYTTVGPESLVRVELHPQTGRLGQVHRLTVIRRDIGPLVRGRILIATLRQLGRELNRLGRLADAYGLWLERITEALEADRGAAYQLDHETGDLVLATTTGSPPDASRPAQILPAEIHPANQLLAGRVIYSNPADYPELAERLGLGPAGGHGSLALLPCLINNQVSSCLVVHRLRGAEPDLQEKAFVEAAVELLAAVGTRLEIFQKLTESEANLRSLIENARDYAVFRIDIGPPDPTLWRIQFVSPSLFEITGATDVMDFSRWSEAVHPEDRERVVEANLKVPENGEFNQVFRYFHSLKNEYRWLHVIAYAVYDRQANPVSANGLIFDITDGKTAEEEVIRQRRRLEEDKVELAQANAALKSLLDQRHRDRQELQQEIMGRVRGMILEEFGRMGVPTDQDGSAMIRFRTRLEELLAPTSPSLETIYGLLTPRQREVAELVRQGRSSTEIAEALGVSLKAVQVHRNRIRARLGLLNKKINLRSHLLSLKADSRD